MISRTDLRRAWHLGSAAARSVADLGPSTTGLVIANTIVQGVKSMARVARGRRSAVHALPGLLTRYEDCTDGASFYFERACLEVRFVTGQIVRITWTPGLLPVAYGLRGPADRTSGLSAPQPSHYGVGGVVHAVHTKPGSRHRAWLPISLLRQTRFALEFCCPPSPCPACLDERLPDPTCLSAEPLMSNQMGE